MKRILALMLMVLFIASSAAIAPVHARQVELSGNAILSVEITNLTGEPLQTAIPTTTIYPTDRILGYSVMSIRTDTNSELYIGIYDSDDTNTSENEVINENESSDHTALNVWLPYPGEITSGVSVRQGANSVVVIYFVRG